MPKETNKEILSKNNFFLPKNKAPHIVIKEWTNSVADGQQTLEDVLVSTNSVRPEIIWAHKSVMSGYSVRSNGDLSLTFAAMFPELKRTFNMARTKSTNVIIHGLTPFKSLLKTSIDRSDFFSFSFESLNEATLTSEMDLQVRWWDLNENKINVCYYRSSFLDHGTNQNCHILMTLLKTFRPQSFVSNINGRTVRFICWNCQKTNLKKLFSAKKT